MLDRSKWRGNSIPVKVNTVVALWNRSLGVRGWNQPHSPLHHFADRAFDHRPTINQKFDLPSRTRTTFITSFSNDNSLLASCHGNHNTHILDVESRKLVRSLSGHARSPWCVTFHPKTNEIVATGSLNGEVRVWDLRGDGSESWTLEAPDEDQVAIASLSFHPYDQVLAIAGGNEIYFWDWSLPQPFAFVKTNTLEEKVRLVRFDPWGHSIITGVGGIEADNEADNARGRQKHGISMGSKSEKYQPSHTALFTDPHLDSDSDLSHAASTTSTMGSLPDNDNRSLAHSRREISETHQRILHARVSVNEEIRQQYTRLQRLRQERHRLEMRLRELQDSANEVRNSTPPIPEPEASLVDNQSLLDHDVAFTPYAASIANSQQPSVLDDHLQSLEVNLHHDTPQRQFSLSRGGINAVGGVMSSAYPSNVTQATQRTAETRDSRTRSFRERLQAIYRTQTDFPSASRTTSRILSQLRQRRIQRETSPRPSPYPSHLSSTYFQPRIAPYVFFPDVPAENASAEDPSGLTHTRSESPGDRVLRPVSRHTVLPPPFDLPRLSPTDVASEAARHRDSYATFFPPSIAPTNTEPESVVAEPEVDVLEQIPIPGAEMAVELGGGHSQEIEPSTSRRPDLSPGSLLSADPMWSPALFVSQPESLLLPNSELDPWPHMMIRGPSPTLLARRRRAERAEQPLRRTAGNSVTLQRWLEETNDYHWSNLQPRTSVIQSVPSPESNRDVDVLSVAPSDEIRRGESAANQRAPTEPAINGSGSTGTMTHQNRLNGSGSTEIMTHQNSWRSSTNQEQPGTSWSTNYHESSLEAAHSLSDAVNSLIEAADDLNEAADSLLHDASASASVLLDDSDSSSSDGAPDPQPASSAPNNVQSRPLRTPAVTSHRRPPSLRRSSLRATVEVDRDRRRRSSLAPPQRPHHPRLSHGRWQSGSRRVDSSHRSRPRRLRPSTIRRLSGPSSINHIISHVYSEHHGHRPNLVGHDRIVYRLQYWNFSKLQLPEISSYRKNVIVPSCKIYNDTSVDISKDGRVVAVFIPANTPDITFSTLSRPMEVAIISLQPKTLGQILFRKGCEHNLVCLSISPLCNRVCVGFRYRHCLIGESRNNKILIGQVFAMDDDEDMTCVQRIHHPAERNIRLVSINTMAWSPQAGGGLAYGTNIGDVRLVSISPTEDSSPKSEMSRL